MTYHLKTNSIALTPGVYPGMTLLCEAYRRSGRSFQESGAPFSGILTSFYYRMFGVSEAIWAYPDTRIMDMHIRKNPGTGACLDTSSVYRTGVPLVLMFRIGPACMSRYLSRYAYRVCMRSKTMSI